MFSQHVVFIYIYMHTYSTYGATQAQHHTSDFAHNDKIEGVAAVLLMSLVKQLQYRLACETAATPFN